MERAEPAYLARLEEQWAEEAEEAAMTPEDRTAAAAPPLASDKPLRMTRPDTGKVGHLTKLHEVQLLSKRSRRPQITGHKQKGCCGCPRPSPTHTQ